MDWCGVWKMSGLFDEIGAFDGDNDEQDTAVEGGNAMMSMFASYYGIEDSTSTVRARGDIDSALFDPNAFVKVSATF